MTQVLHNPMDGEYLSGGFSIVPQSGYWHLSTPRVALLSEAYRLEDRDTLLLLDGAGELTRRGYSIRGEGILRRFPVLYVNYLVASENAVDYTGKRISNVAPARLMLRSPQGTLVVLTGEAALTVKALFEASGVDMLPEDLLTYSSAEVHQAPTGPAIVNEAVLTALLAQV